VSNPQIATKIPTQLIVRDSDGKSVLVPLDRDRITLGRSSVCELAYPDDSGLSRQHMAFVRNGGTWQVQDLGSKNGTLLNGKRLDQATEFRMGDRVMAGHLTIEFQGSNPAARPISDKVVFVETPEANKSTTTVAANLESLIAPSSVDEISQGTIIQANPQMQALIRAGRELVGYRPLNELFEVIMDLAMQAVMAARGVLMTLEDGELVVRASRGAGFKISTTVRDRVLKERTSLLVRDTQLDQALREQKSIVQNKVRGMIAVPLQTNDRVIGLIYVDTPDLIREFTREDLGLLTVMANIAATRIDHARLSEIEATERAMTQELEQAAHIQMGLLPTKSPDVPGMDIAGSTLPCRTVGGDYYDYLTFPDGRVAILVGDVAGKGMPASLLVSSLQARVKVLFEDGDDLAQKITRLNKHTAANCPGNRFITFFMAVVNPATGELVYTNAGHNPPLLIRADGTVEDLKGGGIILGILPIAKYEDVHATMNRGDMLVLYSDGVTEAATPDDDDFGETRLGELAASLRTRPAHEIVAAVQGEVAKFAAGTPQADDITVVVMRRL
jgi:serine phosphatase RsbU (regulator of sigma subunit)/pSer/pThr/pTyr-binding forkhead associated (FHA) protein